MKTATQLVDFVESKVGKAGYWYGAVGEMGTESFLNQLVRQWPKMYTANYIKRSKKWLGHNVADCIGLVKWFVWEGIGYQASQDLSANGTKKACGAKPISGLEEVPGALVFMSGHVGVYVGDGWVVESRGADYGVVKTKLKDRPWTSWGLCPWVSYEEPDSDEFEELKRGSHGQPVKDHQEKLNEKLGINLKVDGDFGRKTEFAVAEFQKVANLHIKRHGVIGIITHTALFK